MQGITADGEFAEVRAAVPACSNHRLPVARHPAMCDRDSAAAAAVQKAMSAS